MTEYNYTAIPVGYYDWIVDHGHPVQSAWHRHKFEAVTSLLPDGRDLSIIDIGCFAGTFLANLPKDWFSRQVGVDILPEQTTFAQDRYGSSYRAFRAYSSTEDLSDMHGQFDCVTIIEVIEHLTAAQIDDMIKCAWKLLKPGGTFIVTTPNYASTWPALEILVNKLSPVDYEHQHITKFARPMFFRRLLGCVPSFDEMFERKFVTTSNFASPFLAPLSRRLSDRVASVFEPNIGRIGVGNLVVARMTRRVG
jgi:cyclopropane fatty-acyl-phospholipid synthase-like methyltransferase